MVEFILSTDWSVGKDGISYLSQSTEDWAGVECKFYGDKLVYLLFVLNVYGDEHNIYNVECRFDGAGYKFRWVNRYEVE